jgi:trehalose synthase
MSEAMARISEVDLHTLPIERYEEVAGPGVVAEIRDLAGRLAEQLDSRVVWHVNSTAAGGGVAEMLPALLGYCRGLQLNTRWLVIGGDPDFFRVTKRLHHALHGENGDGTPLDGQAREIYDATMQANMPELLSLIRAGDIAILHDPQTIGLAPMLSERGVRVIWRCHIGQSKPTQQAAAAWEFLAPYLAHAVQYVFSRAKYVPERLDHGKSVVLPPSIDAFTPKNQALNESTVQTILVHLGVLFGPMPGIPDFEFLRSDGSRGRVDRYADIIRCGPASANTAPLVTQVSRWDVLKDHVGVMQGFARWLERGRDNGAELILAGPSVSGVADDPEGADTFREIFLAWCALPHEQRSRVHLVMLPMVDVEENAVMVNALQRHSRVLVQKSLREGFGLTVTEAMWKGRPVIASRVGGIQDQIRDGENGLLLDDPRDPEAFAAALERLFVDPGFAERLGAAATETVRARYLETRSLRDHLELLLSHAWAGRAPGVEPCQG